MTQQEADAWRKRLIRIWTPQWPLLSTTCDVYEEHLYFTCEVRPGVLVSIFVFDSKPPEADLSYGECELGFINGRIQPYFNVSDVYPDSINLLPQFAEEWLPFFRRNCYLSGCDVECSAHEQIEWTKCLQERREMEL